MNDKEPKSEILSEKHVLLIRLTVLLLLSGLIWWSFSDKKKSSSGNSPAAASSAAGMIPVCADAGEVRLGDDHRETTITVRKDCLSSLIVRRQPEKYDLKVDNPSGSEKIKFYIFRSGKYIGTLSALLNEEKTFRLNPRDTMRLSGYDGTATLRLVN